MQNAAHLAPLALPDYEEPRQPHKLRPPPSRLSQSPAVSSLPPVQRCLFSHRHEITPSKNNTAIHSASPSLTAARAALRTGVYSIRQLSPSPEQKYELLQFWVWGAYDSAEDLPWLTRDC